MANTKRDAVRSSGTALAEPIMAAAEPTRERVSESRQRVNYEDLREEMHYIVSDADKVRRLPSISELLQYVKDIVQGRHV